MDDGLGTLKGALGAGDGLFRGRAAGGAEFLQAGSDNLSQVGLLVAVGDLDGFLKLGILEGAGDLGSELAGLLAGRGEVEIAIDHHGQRPDGLDEEQDSDGASQPSHVFPQPHGAEADCLLTFLEHGEAGNRMRSVMCELSENH